MTEGDFPVLNSAGGIPNADLSLDLIDEFLKLFNEIMLAAGRDDKFIFYRLGGDVLAGKNVLIVNLRSAMFEGFDAMI